MATHRESGGSNVSNSFAREKNRNTPPLAEIVGDRKCQRNFGVYIRARDMWHLDHVTNKEAAELAKDVNEAFGIQILIAGPWTYFPKWLEP